MASKTKWNVLVAFFMTIQTGFAQVDTDVSFTATPTAITGGVTKSLQMLCKLQNYSSVSSNETTTDQTSSSSRYYVNSIVISKSDATGNKEDIGLISLYHPVQGKTDLNSLEVRGQLPLDGQSEPAFLQMTWTNPSRDQSGHYTCEIYALNEMGRVIRFNRSLTVKGETPDVDDVLHYISVLKDDLDSKIASLGRIQNLEVETSQLKKSLREPHVETGVIECGHSDGYTAGHNGYKEKIVAASFKSVYSSKPIVMISWHVLDLDKTHNTRVETRLKSISLDGFQIACATWSDTVVYKMKVMWTSFGFH